MDLRTIMNSDSVGVSSKPLPSQPPPPSPLQHPAREPSPRRTSYPNEPAPPAHPSLSTESRPRPPPPPPLQPPLHSPARSSSYGSAQSPYQHSSASSILSSIPPPPLTSQSHGSQSFLPVARDSFAATSAPVPHPTGSLCSPFTPQPLSSGTQQSYFSQARAHSIHSATTPSSVRSFSFAAPREEPGIHQHVDSQQSLPYSPIQAGSQPATPLAPPLASFRRPSPHTARPPSSGREENTHMVGAWERGDLQREQKTVSPVLQSQFLRQGSSVAERPHRQYLLEQDIDRQTANVSPRTVLKQPSARASAELGPAPDSSSQMHLRHGVERASSQTNSVGSNNPPIHENEHAGQPQSLYPPTTPKTSYPLHPSRPPTMSPTSNPPFNRETDTLPQNLVTPMKATEQTTVPSAPSAFVPRKKRKRFHEPPIYAQRAPRNTGNPPSIPTGLKVARSSLPPKPSFLKREVPDDQPSSRNRSLPPKPSPVRAQDPAIAGANSNGQTRAGSTSKPVSSLGPWEPSITGVIPHEEVTKLICDFLFQQVVLRKDIGAGPAGGAAVGSGAILEVEAKLGQLVDKNRGERLRLPVLTECVVSRDDPSMRLAFESSMTLAQHRSLNNFLNETVKSSMAPGLSRIPLSYAHKKERDTFYEIAPSALPPIVQHHINPRHKPKVRVTTDQRTGAVLARIVKCRLADLDVYSPRTNLDWRISVNLEMNYEGDSSNLTLASDAGPAGKRTGARNKDRMSYRHLAYQIDLTQVATAEANAPVNPQSDFEHELEIEISSAEIRRQGDLALSGDPSNQYEELVKGFVDNVRVLARAVPQRY